jgi:hypothetical protein
MFVTKCYMVVDEVTDRLDFDTLKRPTLEWTPKTGQSGRVDLDRAQDLSEDKIMAPHRSFSFEFKRQVVLDFRRSGRDARIGAQAQSVTEPYPAFGAEVRGWRTHRRSSRRRPRSMASGVGPFIWRIIAQRSKFSSKPRSTHSVFLAVCLDC